MPSGAAWGSWMRAGPEWASPLRIAGSVVRLCHPPEPVTGLRGMRRLVLCGVDMWLRFFGDDVSRVRGGGVKATIAQRLSAAIDPRAEENKGGEEDGTEDAERDG